MAAIGKVFGQGSQQTNRSVHKTTHYERLTQEPSDDEEDDSNVVFLQNAHKLHENGFGSHDDSRQQNGTRSAGQEAIDMGLIQPGRISKGKPDFEVKVMKRRLVTKPQLWLVLLVLLLTAVFALVLMLLLPHITKKMLHITPQQTPDWHKEYDGFGTESCVRLYDVDGDGVKDIIFSTQSAVSIDMEELDRNSIIQFCENKGWSYPCLGQLLALRGSTGELLWNTSIHMAAFEINCGLIDINKDGSPDCMASGRIGLMLAFDPRTGVVLWECDRTVLADSWNVFNPLVMTDLTGDGVPEIVLAHGGDPNFPPQEHDRFPGRLIVIDGSTGQSLGRYLEMPGNKETYMSPVQHTLEDGSKYVLFGSGGETVAGSFLAISWPDLYRYVKRINTTDPVPGTDGSYTAWMNQRHLDHGIIEIYRGQGKGVMVPPVCVNLNGDGVLDIIMSAYDGTVTAYDGQSLDLLWSVSFAGMESYSTPAPAFFNDDEVVDVMMHWNTGAWPEYSASMAVILDGATGKKLWSLNSTQIEMTSDLVVMSTEKNQDVYLFRIQGRISPPSPLHMSKRAASPQLYPEYSNRRNVPLNHPRPQPRNRGDINEYDSNPSRVGSDLTGYRSGPFRSRDREGGVRQDSGYDPQRPSGYRPYNTGSEPVNYDIPWKYPEISNQRKTSQSYPKQPPVYLRERGRGGEMGDAAAAAAGSLGMQESRQFFGGDELHEEEGEEVAGAKTSVDRGDPIPPNTHAILDDTDGDGDDDDDDDDDGMLVTCDSDLNVLTTETFLMDRSCLDAPILLTHNTPAKFTYKVKQSSARKRRHGGPSHVSSVSSEKNERCTILEEQERMTGAVGDVDGDGTLDYIYLSHAQGELDTQGAHIEQKSVVRVHKINIAEHLQQSEDSLHVQVKATVSEQMKKSQSSEKKLNQLEFLPDASQRWAEYLGYQATSVYRPPADRS